MTAPRQDTRRHLTRAEIEVWRAFLQAHARLMRRLEADLDADHGLSLAEYDVLVHLTEAPERTLRMADLAQAVFLSRSGLTRVVDKMERAGLVARARVASDRRGVVARPTERGIDLLRAASHTHLPGVLRHFVDRLDETELTTMGELCRRLAD